MNAAKQAGLIIVILFILLFSLFQQSVAHAQEATPVGRVVWVKGTLKAILPNQEQRTLQRLGQIYLHDTLVTDASTQAQIVFTDNSLMTFRPDTKFYIAEYNFQPKGKKKSAGKYVMNLIEGGFRTITGLVAKASPDNYQINTPVATIGVRGTDFAAYLQNGQLYMGYYSGSPSVSGGVRALCLSKDTPYAHVPSPNTAPLPLTQPPPVMREKLDIVPAKIAQTPAPQSGGGSGKTGTGVNVDSSLTPSGGGTVSSFCVS